MNRLKIILASLIMVFLAIFLVAPNQTLASHKEAENYQFLVGTQFLHGPAITQADNGDTIEITGEGNLNTNSKSASGGGNFTHKDSAGNVIGSGTWTATELRGYRAYGNGTPQGTPANFEGGRARIRVQLTPSGVSGVSFEGFLIVDCVLGDPPSNAREGVRLVIKRLINFDDSLSGETLFIKQ